MNPKKLTLDESLTEALAAHNAFLRLGFEPRELYLNLNFGRLFVTVLSQGRMFNMEISAFTEDEDTVLEEWKKKVAWWNGLTREERDEVYRGSEVLRQSVGLIEAMIAKGFKLSEPKGELFN
jgi:hypothetical protein